MKVLDLFDVLVGLPDFKVTGLEESEGRIVLDARYVGEVRCVSCGGQDLRAKDLRLRKVRHVSVGDRPCELRLESRKWRCRTCDAWFWQRFPGILPRRRASEGYRKAVSLKHWDGIDRKRLSERERIASATVERWFKSYLGLKLKEREGSPCPRVLGIDEHFFSRKQGYATTFCDLGGNKIYDVVLGRSEASLEGFLGRMKGKSEVETICNDLSTTYRALARKHFPKARIVADRFHVVRVVNHHFLNCWKQIDPVGSKNRGLLSLMRRHPQNLKSPEQAQRLDRYLQENPALREIYRFKQKLMQLLLLKHQTRKLVNLSSANCSRSLKTSKQRFFLRSSLWVKPWKLGQKRSQPCGGSPRTTESPKDSTTRWRPSPEGNTVLETSKATGSG